MIHSMIAGRAHGRSTRSHSGPLPDMTDALSTGETVLWRAVVAQAFQDATLGLLGTTKQRKPRPPSAERHVHARAARSWLLGGGGHLQRVCDMAGLDVDAVQEAARRQIAQADAMLASLPARTKPHALEATRPPSARLEAGRAETNRLHRPNLRHPGLAQAEGCGDRA